MTFASRTVQGLASIPKVSTKVGTFVGRAGGLVQVNTGETTVTLPFVGLSLPPAGHPVQMQQVNGQIVVTGPARALPGKGTIVATGSPRATVEAEGSTYSLPYMGSYTPVLLDEVAITWTTGGGLISGSMTAPSPPPTPEVPPPVVVPDPGPQQFQPAPFRAVDTGSWQAGRWTKGDVWASDSLTGFWWYGAGVRDTIPDNARILSAAIYLSPSRTGGSKPNFQLHDSSTRPGSEPSFLGAQYQPPGLSGWQPIPLSFVDQMKNNGFGIGVNHGGYNIFRSRTASPPTGDALSGALDITYEA